MKYCYKCKEIKPFTKFNNDSSKKDGHSDECKECIKMYDLVRFRSKRGKLLDTYHNMVRKSKHRNHPPPSFTKEEFINRFIDDDTYINLHTAWGESNYDTDLAPSFDRLDNFKGYSFDNIQIITWKENNEKGYKDMKEGKVGKRHKPIYSIINGKRTDYVSISQAVRELDIPMTTLRRMLNNTTSMHPHIKIYYK